MVKVKLEEGVALGYRRIEKKTYLFANVARKGEVLLPLDRRHDRLCKNGEHVKFANGVQPVVAPPTQIIFVYGDDIHGRRAAEVWALHKQY